MNKSWIYLADIIKPNLKKGGLILDFSVGPLCYTNDLSKLQEIDCYVVPPEHDLPWIIKFEEFNKINNKWFAKLKGNHEYSDYYNLRNKCLMASANSIIKIFNNNLFEDTKSLNYLLHLDVVDLAYGELGSVSAIYEGDYQSTLEVTEGDNTIMIPFVDEFIKNIDEKQILVSISKALIDLNRS